MASYEFALRAVDGLGLSPVEMDMVVSVIGAYAMGAARPQAQAKKVREATGLSDDEWWYAIEPYLSTRDFSRWPVSQRIGPIVGELYGLGDPDMSFRFGVERLLDGLAVMIEGKR